MHDLVFDHSLLFPWLLEFNQHMLRWNGIQHGIWNRDFNTHNMSMLNSGYRSVCHSHRNPGLRRVWLLLSPTCVSIVYFNVLFIFVSFDTHLPILVFNDVIDSLASCSVSTNSFGLCGPYILSNSINHEGQFIRFVVVNYYKKERIPFSFWSNGWFTKYVSHSYGATPSTSLCEKSVKFIYFSSWNPFYLQN